MSRKKSAQKRKIEPDVNYNSAALSKFINMLMWNGKKAVAEKIVYDALDQVASKHKKEPLQVFNQVIETLSPVVEVKSRRVGGATYSVPAEIRADRRRYLAMSWLIKAARQRGGNTMTKKLAAEISDALEDRGSAMRKKVDVHKTAESSKAFSHLRF